MVHRVAPPRRRRHLAAVRPLRPAVLVLATLLVAAGCSSSDDAGPTTAAPTTTAPPADPVTVTVFAGGDAGYDTFRIPVVVATADGGLLAFAEGRGSTSDDGDVDLVLRRSDDGGRTWGPLQVVVDDGPDFAGNPAPVVDASTGRVLVPFIAKAGTDEEIEIVLGTSEGTSRVLLTTSDDGGATWSAPVDLTAQVKRPEWRWYAVGPGHAIQLRHGPHAGRLVVPANHSDPARGYGAHLVLSDDGGATWTIGAVDTPAGGDRHPNESTAAERPDGTVYVNARDQDGTDAWHRLAATSSDGGASFDAPFTDVVGLVAPVVQASVLAVDDGAVLLLSAPSAPDARFDLRVRRSLDGGATWSTGALVQGGPAGYSDLVALTDGTIGVLYETGDTEAAERIDLALLPGAWLEANDTPAT